MSSQSEIPHLPDMISSDQCRFTIPSRPEWIEPTVEYLKQRAILCGGCHESRANRLTIALHEALTNSIIHGNLEVSSELKERGDDSFARMVSERIADSKYCDRVVTVVMSYDGERSRWSITDEGPGFDTKLHLSKESPTEADMWLASGRGILLMRSFMDHLSYEQGGRRLIMMMDRTSGEEKRVHPRFPLHKKIEVAPIRGDGSVDWDAAYQAITQNYSETGLGIIQNQLTTGDRVIIGIESRDRPTMYLPAQIRHCKNLEEGLVELGCQFQIALNAPSSREALQPVEVAVEGLLDAFRTQAQAESEKRSHQREVYT